MEGVTIVETIYEYSSLIPFEWFYIMVGICLFICFLGECTVAHDIIQEILKCSVVVALIGTIFCGVGVLITTDEVIGERYKVSVSDNVSLVEFYEHYDVISGNGTEFIVKEKKEN